MSNIITAKQVVKDHGVKGFRKLKLKREVYTIGKQCSYINKHVALRLITRLEALGFSIGGKQVTLELAEKGLLDTITLQN